MLKRPMMASWIEGSKPLGRAVMGLPYPVQALRCQYLDLYLIHWPVTGNVGPEVKPSIRETWQASMDRHKACSSQGHAAALHVTRHG